MFKIKVAFAVILLHIIALQGCKKDKEIITTPVETGADTPTLPATPYAYKIAYPNHVAAELLLTDNTPAGNPITDDGATLGRVLFYDKILSANNTISCGSCHKQNESFVDNRALSTGFEGANGKRHSMPLLNIRFYQSGKMFWDERAANLELQVLLPVQDHLEMGSTLTDIVSKVKAKSYYPALFEKAFGSKDIDTTRISRALAQYVRSIVTYQSKYDQILQGSETYTTLEQTGANLFVTPPPPAACSGCHKPPMFITSNPAGPFSLPDPNDLGINNQSRFKSASLRNVALRTSLFHNGSITNLQDMFTRGTPGSGTTPIPAHTIRREDVAALTAFLQTLNDNAILTDERFSNPFK
ncbi:MAG: cytochrome-c peroxidase [Chitinophagaceae bacterium]|jgi:cytochrome c peroxidase